MAGGFLGGSRADDDGPYTSVARNIVQGKGIVWDQGDTTAYSYLPPGPAIVLAPFLALFKNHEWPVRIFYILLSAGAHVIFFFLAKRFFGTRLAFLAALFWISYPPQWFWGSRINPNNYATNGVILCLYLLFVAWEKKSLWMGGLIGLLWSSICLMRAEYLLGLVVLALASYAAIQNKRMAGQFILLLILGSAVGFSPWVLRNYKIHGKFILISTNYGINLWHPFNKDYDYSGRTAPYPPELKKRLMEADNEIERADILVQEAKAFIREDPSAAFKNVAVNFVNFWRPWLSRDSVPLKENILYVLSYIPFFLLFLFGIFRIPWRDPKWMAVYGLVLYKMMVHLPFYVIVRFRESMMPLMLLIAVLSLEALLKKEGWEENV